MNCEKDDLARIVAPGELAHGYVVRCMKLLHVALDERGTLIEGNFWLVIPQVPMCNGRYGNAVRDEKLRPLRDPGDDETDESKAWLPPVPSHSTNDK